MRLRTKILIGVSVVTIAIAIWFGVTWLLTKGFIWAVGGLFNVDWKDKFWMVFVMLTIVQTIFGCAKNTNK